MIYARNDFTRNICIAYLDKRFGEDDKSYILAEDGAPVVVTWMKEGAMPRRVNKFKKQLFYHQFDFIDKHPEAQLCNNVFKFVNPYEQIRLKNHLKRLRKLIRGTSINYY